METCPAPAAPPPARLADLSDTIASLAPHEGDFPTEITGLHVFRRDRPSPPADCLIGPSVVLVAQGAKRLWVGGDAYPYDASHFLVTSLDLPANAEVTRATPETPCLGLALQLDRHVLASLITEGDLRIPRERNTGKGVGIGAISHALTSPLRRLVALLDEPEAIAVLAPLIVREVHFRLLLSDQSARLRQIAAIDGQGHRIARAVDWLKRHYAQPLRVDALAERVQMSTPSFHLHFRQLTAMSPLQYQKWLRLNEARRLMLTEHADVASAAFKVGYESPSQFSREYSRRFGAPPRRDIAQLRASTTQEPALTAA